MVRILAGIVLALLVCAGVFSTTHAQNSDTATTSAMFESASTGVPSVTEGFMSVDAAIDTSHGVTGAAACLIGVLCTLLLVALLRVYLLHRGTARSATIAPRSTQTSLARVLAPPMPPSLHQLSISRT